MGFDVAPRMDTMCSKEIGFTTCSKYDKNHSRFNSKHNWGETYMTI